MENSSSIHPQIINNAGEYNVLYKEKYLYPDKNPLSRIKAKISLIETSKNTLIIIPSPLLFLGIDNIIEKITKSCSLLFIENDRKLFDLKKNPFSEYNYYLLENTVQTEILCRDFDFSGFRKIIMLPLNSGYFINRSFYNNVLKIFQKNLNMFWKNKITKISLSSRWYSNIFKNLPYYLNGSSIEKLKIKGPVFIAGAGESLEKALPLIKEFKPHFTLIAIDTAVSTIINYGIKPDFILAVESQFYNIYDFYECLNSQIPLICDISSYPATPRITGGKNYFFFSEFSSSRFLKTMYEKTLLPKKIPPLGSVGIIAVYISLFLTESEIIYSGLDFSFIPGKSHSRNSPFITMTSLLKNRTEVKSNYAFCLKGEYSLINDVNGRKVYTNSNLRSYSESFKEILSRSNRIYSLYRTGITLNKNVITSKKELRNLISNRKIENPIKLDKTTKDFKENLFSKIKDFYKIEYKNIQKIINISIDMLNSRNDLSSFDLLKDLLMHSDYITEDFPENKIPEAITSPYLKRVLLSCYKYERILKNTLKSF